jgi:hypothetical protein
MTMAGAFGQLVQFVCCYAFELTSLAIGPAVAVLLGDFAGGAGCARAIAGAGIVVAFACKHALKTAAEWQTNWLLPLASASGGLAPQSSPVESRGRERAAKREFSLR